jgi:hypothetical protein
LPQNDIRKKEKEKEIGNARKLKSEGTAKEESENM